MSDSDAPEETTGHVDANERVAVRWSMDWWHEVQHTCWEGWEATERETERPRERPRDVYTGFAV